MLCELDCFNCRGRIYIAWQLLNEVRVKIILISSRHWWLFVTATSAIWTLLMPLLPTWDYHPYDRSAVWRFYIPGKKRSLLWHYTYTLILTINLNPNHNPLNYPISTHSLYLILTLILTPNPSLTLTINTVTLWTNNLHEGLKNLQIWEKSWAWLSEGKKET